MSKQTNNKLTSHKIDIENVLLTIGVCIQTRVSMETDAHNVGMSDLFQIDPFEIVVREDEGAKS